MTGGKGARAKLRAFFLEHVGEVITSDTLREVAGVSEWARRLRELRNEEGFQILSHNDRSDLKPGQYILQDPTPREAFARQLGKEVRAFVLDRDGFTCQMCGAVAAEPHPFEPTRTTHLQVGHVVDKSLGGSDDLSNLVTLCSVCNEGAANLTLDRPSHLKLLVQIRRATSEDQKAALVWLIRKFPAVAGQAVAALRQRADVVEAGKHVSVGAAILEP